jgi:hypothetical protein
MGAANTTIDHARNGITADNRRVRSRDASNALVDRVVQHCWSKQEGVVCRNAQLESTIQGYTDRLTHLKEQHSLRRTRHNLHVIIYNLEDAYARARVEADPCSGGSHTQALVPSALSMLNTSLDRRNALNRSQTGFFNLDFTSDLGARHGF